MGLGVRQEGRRNRYPPTESVRSNFPPKTYLKWPPRENLHRRRHKPKRWPPRHVLRMRSRQERGKPAKERLRMRGPEENRGIDCDQNSEQLRRAAKGSPAEPTQKQKRAGERV
ncbi:Hypothetical predicted protein [Pelobates cultripes]|uniref:Uncharacterized protein n=1 Tax=Pelobates cultripes TaxID=61616 RepID=A0AAD1S4L9_PELCU|nr:Hypothetical predicted protein [Pelobates cultripes]